MAIDRILQEIFPIFYQLSSLEFELDPDISNIMLQISVDRNFVVKYYNQREMVALLSSEVRELSLCNCVR